MSSSTYTTTIANVTGNKRKYDTPYNSSKRILVRLRPRDVQTLENNKGYMTSGHQQPKRGSRNRSKWAAMDTRSDPVYPRPEVKNLDVSFGTLAVPAPVTSTGAPADILSLAQGTTAVTRIGRRVAVKSVYYQFTVEFDPGQEEPLVFRHILFWDRQSNGTGVTGTTINDLLQSQPYVVSPMNLNNNQRFIVLADDRTTLSPNGDQIRIVSGFRKINQFSEFSNSNVIPQSGALRVLFVSDIDGTFPPTFYGTWRVRYIDD